MAEVQIDAYIIVTDDFHASEYVDDYFKCREYISGFTGSAGTLVVTENQAGLWTDGRYFLQAADQLEGTGITLMKKGEEDVPTIEEFLGNNMDEGQCIGYDGRTMNAKYANSIKEELEGMDITFVENIDLVGEMWEDRPAFPENPVWELDVKYAGESRASKLERLREQLKEYGADYHLLASLDDICWLYNIRGNDIAYTPVAMCYTIITSVQAILYISENAVNDEIKANLQADGITLRPYFQIYEDINGFEPGRGLLVDPATTNIAIMNSLPEGLFVCEDTNPTLYMKSIKNEIEIANEREAHIQDGVAVTKLICWLKNYVGSQDYLNNIETELSVSDRLLSYRKERPDFVDQSFAPIIATGAHGAIVHYESTPETDIPLVHDSFLLMDTGGHYLNGTTDITRTIAIGNVSDEMRKHYTAVLKGNLNLAAAKFKYGCTGAGLDYLARNPLWELGLDYNHGTGHGVGYLMSVHEGPQRISVYGDNDINFEAGMITSDEPGLYLEVQYGIRTENLILCVNREKNSYGQFMGFETLTMVPFDRDAIDVSMMSDREIELLDSYHKKVFENIAPFLEENERQWLAQVTAPI